MQNEIKSAKESISLPKSLDMFIFRAILPSSTSNTAAIKTR